MIKEQPAPQQSSAHEASRQAVAILSIMESLSRVLDQEVSLVNERNYDALLPLSEERAKWVREYHTNMAALAQKPDLLKEATPEERLRLRKQGEIFFRCAQNHSSCLKGAITATQALVQTVMDAARDQNKSSDCYSDPRKTPLMMGSYSPTCNPVAINRTA